MKLKMLAHVILIIIVLAAIPAPIESEAPYFTVVKVYWGVDRLIEVSPGDVATLTVILRYESDSSTRSVTANLSLPEGFKAVGGTDQALAYYSGTIALGSIVKLEFPIFITPDAVIDNYTTSLELYIGNYTTVETLEVSFEVTGKPKIGIKALNSSLCEGKQQLSIALPNEGDAIADNLKITKVYASGASAELVGNASLGNLEPGDNVTVPILMYVPAGIKGSLLPLTIEVSCVGPRSVLYLFSNTIQLLLNPSTLMLPLTLSVEPEELVIGKSSNVYLELMNNGTHTLSGIKLYLSPDAILRIFGSTKFYVDRLEPEESRQVCTEIYVPSTIIAPTASLTITMTYFDEDLEVAQSDDQRLNMLLRGLIEISLTDVAVIPSTPRSGSPFSITFTVTNIGTSAAYAAYAIPLIEVIPVTPFGPRSVYIGNIELNLPTTFTVNLQMGSTAEERITLPVVLSYMDNLRTLYNVTFSIPISVAPPTGTTSQQTQRGLEIFGVPILTIATILGVAATILVVSIVILKRMRRKG